MDNKDELLDTVYLEKRGISLIMDEQDITTIDIMNNFYKLTQNVRELGVCNFALADYNVVYGDFITGIQYIKDDKTYYMMVSANSRFAPPQQVAVGMLDKENIYMMSEDFPNTTSIGLVAFPRFLINQRSKGFVPKSYRDTIHLLRARSTLVNSESKKCLEYGFEAMDVFCSLINQIKNQDKRKKLSI